MPTYDCTGHQSRYLDRDELAAFNRSAREAAPEHGEDFAMVRECATCGCVYAYRAAPLKHISLTLKVDE